MTHRSRRCALLLIVLAVTATTQALSPPAKGSRVLGQWSDGRWYPARIEAILPEAIRVAFDDGDIALLEPAKTRALDWRAGTAVQCNKGNQGLFFNARIASMDGELIEIAYADGAQESASISRCRTP